MMRRRTFLRRLGGLGLVVPTARASRREPPPHLRAQAALWRKDPRAAAVAWFREAKFGLFIHYGLDSLLGRGEWVLFHENIPIAEYKTLRDRFSASKFDARAIAGLAAEAGMRYVNLVGKHCDSFCLWATDTTDFNSARSPARRDLVAEMAAACRELGLGFFVFYEHGFDWVHPHGPAPWDWRAKAVRPACDPADPHYAPPERYDFGEYLRYVEPHITELCSNFGPVAGVWLDGIAVPLSGDRSRFRMPELYAQIRHLQPHALISYKSGLYPELGDFMAPDKFPIEAAQKNRGAKPMEICRTTLKHSARAAKGALWGWLDGAEHVSPEEVLAMLDECARPDANLLPNVGSLPEGDLHPHDIATLREVGRRLRARQGGGST
ncbi:MAG: alpha-L-fucosidase [Kiritimatiellae bacterium]|nr:alpha-L-fucosidase [Kiritimatiellia bacterium]